MRALCWILVPVLFACEGASSDPGVSALVRVKDAQFVPGAMPAAEDGPPIVTVNNNRTRIVIGETAKSLQGALDPAATAVAIGYFGDPGYWISTATMPFVDTPDFPSFDVKIEFSTALPPGPFELVVRAVDRAERYGPPVRVSLEATALTAAEGELVVSLSWDTNADLDLHLVDPAGKEIWARNPREGNGLLELDSNASCLIDGRRLEGIGYAMSPPSGHYVARVDAFSLCDEFAARWTVEVFLRGTLLGRARGTAVDSDTRGPHDSGAGVTALTFEVP